MWKHLEPKEGIFVSFDASKEIATAAKSGKKNLTIDWILKRKWTTHEKRKSPSAAASRLPAFGWRHGRAEGLFKETKPNSWFLFRLMAGRAYFFSIDEKKQKSRLASFLA